MPFSKTSEEHTEQYWTSHFKTFLKTLIEESPNVKAYRSEPLRGDVLRQIITDLVVSPIVVADLTDNNPNVFWELGVRQSFKHGTITIAETGTKIPFDVSVKGVLFYYPKDHIKNAEFAKSFKKAIQDILSNPDSPDSHVLEAISGRGTLYEIIRRDEALRRLDALLSESEDNRSIVEDIYNEVKKPDKERERIIARFRTLAVELLITNRYLDESPSFYEMAETYCNWMRGLNEELSTFEQAKTISYLKTNKKMFTD